MDTLTLLQTATDPLTDFTDHYKTSFTHYVLHYIYSIADISKQVDEG